MASHRLVGLLTLAVALCTVAGARLRSYNNRTVHISATSVVEKHGFLSVRGNKIIDKTGSPVRLRGMSLFWSQWKPQYWNADVVNWLKNDWHATVIRAPMGVCCGGYLDNPEVEKARLQAVVDACIAAGIYVVIDWHDHNADQHVWQAKEFFSEMAHKYGGYPNVLFELFNEPEHQSWSGTIKPYHEQVLPVIRQHTKNIAILGTRFWSQKVEEASWDPVRGENLAYTVHFYAHMSEEYGRNFRNEVSAAMSNGIAIFATEWGACDANDPGSHTLSLDESQRWLQFFQQHHISDANWAISDLPDCCNEALRPDASANGGWGEDQLNPSGRWVRKSMRGEGGCCKFGSDCGDCGWDGNGWCHESASNCVSCQGSFDYLAIAPQCGPVPTPAPQPSNGYPKGVPVYIRSHRQQYLYDDANLSLSPNADDAWGEWTIRDSEDGKVMIQSHRERNLQDYEGKVMLTGNQGFWEQWMILDVGNGKVAIQSHRNEYLQDDNGRLELSGNTQEWEQWSIVPKVANDYPKGVPVYIRSHRQQNLGATYPGDGNPGLTDNADAWERWTIEDAGDGKVTIWSHQKQLLQDHYGDVLLSGHAGSWEQWSIYDGGNGKVFIQSHRNKQLLDDNGQLKLSGNMQQWEQWSIIPA